MKKRKTHFQFSIFNFQWLIALVLAFASCADKDNVLPAGARGVSINVTLPDDGSLSRSVPTAPEGHALRCVLEARAKDDNTLKARVEQIAEGTASLSLKFDLEAAGEYTVVLWADYIAAGTTAMDATLDGVTFRHYPDKYYKTDDADGLQHVFVITPYNTYTTPDVRDAFTGTVAFTKGAVAVTDLSVSLTRPLSRVTIAEKNAENFALCSTVTATYKVPAAINALTGELVAGEQTDVTLSGTPSPDATVTVSGTPCHILLSDLVLATADGTMGTIALDFTATPEAAVDHYLPPLTIPAGVPARRAFRVNAAGNLIAPTDPLSRVILAVDIDDSWGTHDVEKTFFIPDANFRQFCIDNGYADADGHIILAEAAKVTELNVHYKGIASLEGIEYFTGLTELVCSQNSLTTLDVSRCTELLSLECRSNNLTELNVSGCTKLTTLGCDDNPKLTSLDVSECTKLTTLDCQHDQSIAALDVSKCTMLDILICDDTSLTLLDVSKCTALTIFSCSDNPNLSELNMTGCTALEALYFDDTPKLNEIDLSTCTGLIRLTGYGNSLTTLDVTKCTALEYIEFRGNSITTVDISGCTTLKEVAFYRNPNLTKLNAAGCTAITMLDCYENPNLTELNVKGCSALDELYCPQNSLTSLDVSECKVLTKLFCDNNPKLTSLDVSECTELEELYCNENSLLTRLNVTQCIKLTELHCDNNPKLTSLDVSECTELKKLLCNDNSLSSLDVSGCTELEELYCNDNSLSSLDVSGCPALYWLECHNNLLSKLDVSMTLNPDSYYYLYCGNQGTEEGDPRELTLTLTAEQQTRWDSVLKEDEENRNDNVKVK